MCSLGFNERKQYTKAVRLLRKVVDKDPEFHLFIKANPEQESFFAQQCFEEVLEQGLEGHIHFIVPEEDPEFTAMLSSKHDIRNVYANMDIVLSTSRHEAFHYAVGEGMLTGLYPIVANWEWGEPRQFWGPYVANDDDELVERIVAWGRLSEPEKLEESRKARQYCIERLGLDITRRRFAKLFPPLQSVQTRARKRLILFAHHHLYKWSPHGGERSMARVMEYLRDEGYECLIVVANRKNEKFERDNTSGFPIISVPHRQFSRAVLDILEWWRPDVALTWSLPAKEIAPICAGKGIPYIVFVRYWHLFNPPPYHNLLTDPIDAEQQHIILPIFKNASAVIAIAEHVHKVIRRFFDVDSVVSYVPVEKREPLLPVEQRKYVTLVNPRKAGGKFIVTQLAQRNPDIDFLVIESAARDTYPPNVTKRPYIDDTYEVVFKDTKVLLFPFDEDPCGTGRVVYEAYYLGIPVLSVDKGGLSEVIPKEHLVAEYDRVDEWDQKLKEILAQFPEISRQVRGLMKGYSEIEEMDKVRRAIDAAVDSTPTYSYPFHSDHPDRQFVIAGRVETVTEDTESVETGRREIQGGYALFQDVFQSNHGFKGHWYTRNARINTYDNGIKVVIHKRKSAIATGGPIPLKYPPLYHHGLVPSDVRHFASSFQITVDGGLNRLAIVLYEYGDSHFSRKRIIHRVNMDKESSLPVYISGTLAPETKQIRLSFYNHDQIGSYAIEDFDMQVFEMQVFDEDPASPDPMDMRLGFVLEQQRMFDR
jgi:glycosyltransferase involved in cell wall biosynthesis